MSEEKSLFLEILAPDGTSVKKEITEVIFPSITGSIGVLPQHVSTISGLDIGVIRYLEVGSSKWFPIVILGGLGTIYPNKVTVLTSEILIPTKEDCKNAEGLLSKAAEEYATAQTPADKMKASQNIKVAVAKVEASRFLEAL